MRFFARTAEVSTEKHRESIASQENDVVAIEEPMEIWVSYVEENVRKSLLLSLTMRTPGQDEELALGFLFAEGVITSIGDVLSIETHGVAGRDKPFSKGITIHFASHVAFDATQLKRNFFSTSSCGVCGRISIDHLLKHKTHTCQLDDGTRELIGVSPAILYQLSERINESQNVFQHTGGIHAAALFNLDGALVYLCEDVGRHNAMDKLVGQALQKQHTFPLQNYMVLFSGRVSYELVQKALVAGIPIIAAIGAPSSLAIEIANSYNITLIGFLRDRRFNVYSAPQRVTSDE